jgi:hypothetical protein
MNNEGSINRIKVALPQREYRALLNLCQIDLRNPPDELRWILRQELFRRGLLKIEELDTAYLK